MRGLLGPSLAGGVEGGERGGWALGEETLIGPSPLLPLSSLCFPESLKEEVGQLASFKMTEDKLFDPDWLALNSDAICRKRQIPLRIDKKSTWNIHLSKK